MRLAGAQDGLDGHPVGVGSEMNFGREITSKTPKILALSAFLNPAEQMMPTGGGAVDHLQRIGRTPTIGKGLEHRIPDPAHDPTPELSVRGVPVAKAPPANHATALRCVRSRQ